MTTHILSLDEIRKRLKFMNVSAVAKEIGMSPNGLYKIIGGESDPLYSSVKSLSDFLDAK